LWLLSILSYLNTTLAYLTGLATYSIIFFYLARQRVRDIEEKGYFTIGLRAVQERLNLPSEVGNKDPQRTIKELLEEAVTAIEEAAKT
jgi:hypothetical protein